MLQTKKEIEVGDHLLTLKISDPDNYLRRVVKNVFNFEDAIKNLVIEVVKIEEKPKKRLVSRTEPIPKYPEILVLFLKKSTASLLIEKIIEDRRMPLGVENQLFVNTLKMWVGTRDAYRHSDIQSEFEKPEYTDSFVKEYDYVALKFSLSNKSYSGYKKNDGSYERNLFFQQICSEGVSLIEYSKTLSFDNGISLDVYDV